MNLKVFGIKSLVGGVFALVSAFVSAAGETPQYAIMPERLGPYVVGQVVSQAFEVVSSETGDPVDPQTWVPYTMKYQQGFKVEVKEGVYVDTLPETCWTPSQGEEAQTREFKMEFDFPIAGMSVRNVSVGANGQISLVKSGENGDEQELYIHPFPYANVSMTEQDDGIYSELTPTSSFFRIKGRLRSRPVNYSVALYDDGRVVMAYPKDWSFDGSDGYPAIFAHCGNKAVSGEIDATMAQSIGNSNDAIVFSPSVLPPGLELNVTGDGVDVPTLNLIGSPTTPGEYHFTMQVEIENEGAVTANDNILLARDYLITVLPADRSWDEINEPVVEMDDAAGSMSVNMPDDGPKLTMVIGEPDTTQAPGSEVRFGVLDGYEGVVNVVVVKDDKGNTIVDVRDFMRNRAYVVITGSNGVSRVREFTPNPRGLAPDDNDTVKVSDPDRARTSAAAAFSPVSRAAYAAGASSSAVNIDVLVAYDSNAMGYLGTEGYTMQGFAAMSIARMNAVVENSGLGTDYRFRLAGVLDVGKCANGDFSGSLVGMHNATDGWGVVKAKRDEVGADIVTLLLDTDPSGDHSGLGFIQTGLGYSLEWMPDKLKDEYGLSLKDYFGEYAYNVCSIRAVAQSNTMAHEIGHNMGAGHGDSDYMDAGNCGPQSENCSCGYYFFVAEQGYFTVMSYNMDKNGRIYSEVPYYSSPDCQWNGVQVGDAGHDNVSVLRKTCRAISEFRAEKSGGGTDTPPISGSDDDNEGTDWGADDFLYGDGGAMSPGAAPYVAAAAVYDGYLVQDGVVKGTVQVKIAKGKRDRVSGVLSAKVTVTVQLSDGSRKLTFKGGFADEAGQVTRMSVGGHELDLKVGVRGLGGKFDGACLIDGARNVFSGKMPEDRSIAEGAMSSYGKTYNVAFAEGTLSVTVAKKGKVKVTGTINGNKVSTTSQLLVGDNGAVVPVVIVKKANVSFGIRLSADGNVKVRGLSSGVSLLAVGPAGQIQSGAKFSLGAAAPAGFSAVPSPYADYLPNGVEVSPNGTKWIVAGGAKASKLILLDKIAGTLDPEKSKITDNKSGLKLTYKAKDGTFTGSFKVYGFVSGKIKTYTAKVTGAMIGAKGYGTATIKNVGSVPITIE